MIRLLNPLRIVVLLVVLSCVAALPVMLRAVPDPEAVAVPAEVAATLPSPVSAVASLTDTSPETQIARLKYAAVQKAANGQWSDALGILKQAAGIDDKDAGVTAARDLITQYEQAAGKVEQQRAAEYKEAVVRVQKCQLAQGYLPRLEAGGLAKKLHQKMQDMVAAYKPGRRSRWRRPARPRPRA